jgi:hypothetical protein
MDLATLRWTPIADSKHKTSGSCLVGYRDKYILKIGGKVDIFTPCTAIEVYEIARDYWTELDYQFSGAGYLRLPFNAAAVDIGQRKILVFGGSVHDVKSNESSVYICKAPLDYLTERAIDSSSTDHDHSKHSATH